MLSCLTTTDGRTRWLPTLRRIVMRIDFEARSSEDGVISRLIALWQRLHLGRPSLAEVRYVASPADVPDRLSRRELVVVGTGAFPKWAVFDCPCGRGHRIMLSLQRSHRPHWGLEIGGHGPPLWPSVDSVAAYRCHFWLRDGRVRWVRSWPWREPSAASEERETASAA